MELHTLGVDGGYTQQDVQEVARCFTGWSIDRQTGEFIFRPRQHDNGAKVVLGHANSRRRRHAGRRNGARYSLRHPATAHHIALEMCQRFVSDDPLAGVGGPHRGRLHADRRRPAQGDRGDPDQPRISFPGQLQQQDQVAAGIRGLRGARLGIVDRRRNSRLPTTS